MPCPWAAAVPVARTSRVSRIDAIDAGSSVATVSVTMSAVRSARGIAKRRSRLTPETTAVAAKRQTKGSSGTTNRPAPSGLTDHR